MLVGFATSGDNFSVIFQNYHLFGKNMTTKKLFVIWAFLGALSAVSFLIHTNTMKRAEEVAWQQAPRYVPLTDTAAVLEYSYNDCEEDPARELIFLYRNMDCNKAHANPTQRMVDEAIEIHKNKFYRREVLPLKYKVEKASKSNTEFFMTTILGFAAAALLFWFKSVALPRLAKTKSDITERSDIAQNLKAAGANRKVRKAESDFSTIKNLHENGLISDEMFEKRKDELREALSENKIFRN